MKIFLLLCLFITFILNTIALDDHVYIINRHPKISSKSSNSQNRSESNEIVYVCEKDSPKSCNCNYRQNHLQCDLSHDKRIHTANLGIRNQSFILKSVVLWVDVENVKKGHILPGREHTVDDLFFAPFDVKTFENGTFDAFDKLKNLQLKISDDSVEIDNGILTQKLGTTLESLTLNHYSAKGIPSTAFQYLTKLKYLDLEGSEVQLSKELFSKSLENLESLLLEYCKITSLDDDIFENLRNLKVLDLSGNPITSIPKAINLLLNLKSLQLRRNDIAIFNHEDLIKNQNLKELDLHFTENLKSIGDCAFCNFSNLEEVELYSSHIESIHENAFGRLTGKNATKLRKFRIDHSSITVLPEKLLDWKSVRELYLSDNSYVCNCSMAWLINNYQNYTRNLVFLDYKKVKSLQCANPPALKDKTFNEISLENCDSNDAVADLPGASKSKINKEAIAEEKPISKWLITVFLFFIIAFICILSYATYRHFKARKARRLSTHEFEILNDGMAMDDL